MKKRIPSILLTLVLALSLAVPALAADEGDGTLQYFGGHTYLLVKEAMTPVAAEQYCTQQGGHLVTVTSEEENQFLCQIFESDHGSGYILGGTDRDEEGTWTWMTGEPWDFTYWYSGEPNNGLGQGENYVYAEQTRKWHWVDFFGGWDNETSQFPFLCEWDYIASDWAQTEIEQAKELDLIPEVLQNQDLTRPITRMEFAAVAVKVFESLSGGKAVPIVNNPFQDTSDLEVLKAFQIGAVDGTSATTFEPDALLNREQCAAMLTRVYKKITLAGWTLPTDGQFKLPYTMPARFADDADISDWAKDSVYFMAANKIIEGVGGNRFAPKNTTSEQAAIGYANATREQALAIAVRMVKNLP